MQHVLLRCSEKENSRLYLIVALSCILPPNNNENLSLSTLQNHTKRNQKFGASEGKNVSELDARESGEQRASSAQIPEEPI